MKRLVFRFVLPITVISFVSVTKWWHVKIDDTPDLRLYGFPLPYRGPGLHTSLSTNFFVIEFTIDILFYFLCIYMISYVANCHIWKFSISKKGAVVLWTIAFLIVSYPLMLASLSDNVFIAHRDFSIEVVSSGISFITDAHKPDFP